MLRVRKTPVHPFLASLSTASLYIKNTCVGLKLGAKAAPRTVKPAHAIYKSAVLREVRKVCTGVLSHTDIFSQTVKFLTDRIY